MPGKDPSVLFQWVLWSNWIDVVQYHDRHVLVLATFEGETLADRTVKSVVLLDRSVIPKA